jgi:hypothetical protein
MWRMLRVVRSEAGEDCRSSTKPLVSPSENRHPLLKPPPQPEIRLRSRTALQMLLIMTSGSLTRKHHSPGELLPHFHELLPPNPPFQDMGQIVSVGECLSFHQKGQAGEDCATIFDLGMGNAGPESKDTPEGYRCKNSRRPL